MLLHKGGGYKKQHVFLIIFTVFDKFLCNPFGKKAVGHLFFNRFAAHAVIQVQHDGTLQRFGNHFLNLLHHKYTGFLLQKVAVSLFEGVSPVSQGTDKIYGFLIVTEPVGVDVRTVFADIEKQPFGISGEGLSRVEGPDMSGIKIGRKMKIFFSGIEVYCI